MPCKNTRLGDSCGIEKSLSTDSLAKSHKCIHSVQWGTNIPAQPLLWGSPFVAIFVSLFSGFNILVPFSTSGQLIVPSFWTPDKICPVTQRDRRKVLIQQLNWFGDTTQLLDNCNTSMEQIQEGKARSRFYEYLLGQWECPETELNRMEKKNQDPIH